MKLELNGSNLNIKDVELFANKKCQLELSDISIEKINRSAKFVIDAVNSEKIIYGITTGFGELVKFIIPTSQSVTLQENLIKSHACAVAPYFNESESRAIVLSRINCLANGYSGIKLELIDTLIKILNAGWTPQIPQTGSLGASGDLGPLAHIGLIFIGEGFLINGEKISPTKDVLKELNIELPQISSKEGLSIINGTSAMTGIASLNILTASRLLDAAIKISSLSLQSLLASSSPFKSSGHKLKRHKGQIFIADKIYSLLNGSDLTNTDEERMDEIKTTNSTFSETSLQDAYTLRCIPQVLGMSFETIQNVYETVENELNSINDNPIILENNDIFHGGNFHGQYISTSMDYLAICLNHIGMLSERRLARMLDPKLSQGLSPFLAGEMAGLNCGLAGVQYMSTSMVAENNFLCSPVSIRSIPSNGNNQDFVSMGLLSARRTRDILYNLSNILAIELIASVQAINQRGSDKLSPASQTIYKKVLEYISPWKQDRMFSNEIQAIAKVLRDGDELLSNEHEILNYE